MKKVALINTKGLKPAYIANVDVFIRNLIFQPLNVANNFMEIEELFRYFTILK